MSAASPELTKTVRRVAEVLQHAAAPTGDLVAEVDALVANVLALCESLQAREDASGDVAFVACGELRPLRVRIARATGEDERRDEVHRALRRVARVVGALDFAVNGVGDAPDVVGAHMVELSLTTRRAYARFRRAVLHHRRDDTTLAMERVLERARVQLAILTRDVAAGSTRPHDCAQIAALSARVTSMIAAGATIEEARRLWQDMEGLARLTVEVSRRHELVAHDTALVDQAWESLVGATDIEPRWRARLGRLIGLDEEADRLIEDCEWDVESWRVVLGRLHARLVRPATGRFPTSKPA